MDSSRECRHATCPAISPGCERCVTSRNRSPSSPPDPVNSLRPRKRRADPSIAAVHACPNAPTRAVNQPYSLPHRRNTGRAQPTATRNTRIPVSREIDASIYFYDIHSQVKLRQIEGCSRYRFGDVGRTAALRQHRHEPGQIRSRLIDVLIDEVPFPTHAEPDTGCFLADDT